MAAEWELLRGLFGQLRRGNRLGQASRKSQDGGLRLLRVGIDKHHEILGEILVRRNITAGDRLQIVRKIADPVRVLFIERREGTIGLAAGCGQGDNENESEYDWWFHAPQSG